ncbi:MAG: diacylglycerol kinase family protein [Planctomycetota bacterium]
MRGHGVPTDLHLTERRRDGWRRVRSMHEDTDAVVAVGGDGTLGEVLSGLVDRDVAVGQLPMGTADVLAKDARIPRDVDGTIEMVLRGRTSVLDAATVNGRISFLCVGSGFDGYCVEEVERRRKGPITKFDYVRATGTVLRKARQPRLGLEIDGEKIAGEFGFVLVSNVREYGAVFHLSSLSRRDDGKVEVYALRNASNWNLARMAVTGMVRELPGSVADFWQAERVRITADQDVPWQLDGDLGGHGSVDYQLTGTRFRLLVP